MLLPILFCREDGILFSITIRIIALMKNGSCQTYFFQSSRGTCVYTAPLIRMMRIFVSSMKMEYMLILLRIQRASLVLKENLPIRFGKLYMMLIASNLNSRIFFRMVIIGEHVLRNNYFTKSYRVFTLPFLHICARDIMIQIRKSGL